MTNNELIQKHGLPLIKDIAFYEDLEPNKPLFWKLEQVAKLHPTVDIKTIEGVYKNYQHNMEA